MMTARSFRFGGMQLPSNKLTPDFPIPNAFLPTDAVIPLRQHAGSSAKRIVEPGEYIREGQLIGKAAGAGSANIHSPIPGVVKEIRNVPGATGGQVEALVLALEGSFERLGKKKEIFPWKSLSKHQILRTIADNGVVDDDGSGSPLFERLHDPKSPRGPCVLVVNCIESDPWNSSSSAILVERAQAVFEGMGILKRILSPVRTLLCVDSQDVSSLDAVSALSAQEEERPEIIPLETRYPQDLPTLLKEAIAGRKNSPEEIVVISVTTLTSVYDAVALGKPQIERYVTISGNAVKNPGILRARIGTSIGELLEECGGFRAEPESILMDGPFRGSCVTDLDMPVLKTTRSVIALTASETRRSRTAACIRCGRCVLGCPEKLNPSRLYKRIVKRNLAEAVREGLSECTECGTCAYLCPSRLPLVQVFSLARQDAASTGIAAEAEGRTV